MNHITRWDTAIWGWNFASMGYGVSGPVLGLRLDSSQNLLAADGRGNVYVGGFLRAADGLIVSNIAKWDETRWSVLGNGLSGPIYALVVDKTGTLYAADGFMYICADASCSPGTRVNEVARWNPLSATWSMLGNGLQWYVSALALDDTNNLFAGGDFLNLCAYETCTSVTQSNTLQNGTGAPGLRWAVALEQIILDLLWPH